jgi:cell division protein FtsB
MSDQDDTNKADDTTDDAGTDRADDKAEGADQLGDAGKKALDAMKAQRAAARKERDDARAEAAALKAENAKLKGGDKDKATEVDEKAIREAARAEAQAEALADRVLDRIEAKAAKLFADPEDARALLAGRAAEFIDDGKVDNDAIGEALADLLKKKPHLGAQGGRRFEGSADGGARKGSNAPAQLTEQDLKRMTPEQIVEARAKGQLATLLG